jgi:hypothetical protein
MRLWDNNINERDATKERLRKDVSGGIMFLQARLGGEKRREGDGRMRGEKGEVRGEGSEG